jgi:hypothetical protein
MLAAPLLGFLLLLSDHIHGGATLAKRQVNMGSSNIYLNRETGQTFRRNHLGL